MPGRLNGARAISCAISRSISGGCWEHTIIIEHLFEPVAGVVYPRLIEATGRCPPDEPRGKYAVLYITLMGQFTKLVKPDYILPASRSLAAEAGGATRFVAGRRSMETPCL